MEKNVKKSKKALDPRVSLDGLDNHKMTGLDNRRKDMVSKPKRKIKANKAAMAYS